MDEQWEGIPANASFLLLLPSKQWPISCQRLGLSQEMYAACVKLVIIAAGVASNEIDATAEEWTGESLDSY